jgi:hypothetical protein
VVRRQRTHAERFGVGALGESTPQSEEINQPGKLFLDTEIARVRNWTPRGWSPL